MYCDALKWWIRTLAEKRRAWVPAIRQTHYHYAVWVIPYKPICHTEKVSRAMWFTACNGLGEIYLDFSNVCKITDLAHQQTVFYLLNLIRTPWANAKKRWLYLDGHQKGTAWWSATTNHHQSSPTWAVCLTLEDLYGLIHRAIDLCMCGQC